MKLQVDITTEDGEHQLCAVRPRTQVAYERHFKVQLNSEIGMEQLYWLAWHSSGTTAKFEAWLDTIESVAAVAPDMEGDDPLAMEAPSGTSSPSPSKVGLESPSTS